MRPNDPEFLIAQYADGSLDPQRVAEVEGVLRRDPAARATLAAYRAVDAALAGVPRHQPAPEVRWDQLQAAIGDRVSALADADPLAEAVEERLSRYGAGDVSADERSAVEAALSADPQARVVLGEYASLDRVLDAARAAPLPDVRWDALAAHLSRAIDSQSVDSQVGDAQGVPAAASSPMRLVQPAAVPAAASAAAAASAGHAGPAVLGRIGRLLAQPRRLAVAACLLVAASLSVRLVTQGDKPAPATPQAVAPAVQPRPQTVVIGPRAGGEGSAPVAVRFGPPASAEVASDVLRRDEADSKPGTLMIVSEKPTGQDTTDQTKNPKNAPDSTAQQFP